MKTDFKTMNQLLKDAKTVAIVCHIRPDGDSIGSSVALRLALLGMGKKTADIFVDDFVPETFSYLTGIDQIKDKTFIDNNPWQKYDLMVIIDSSTEDRIARCTQLRGYVKKVLVIDHHKKTYINGESVAVTNAEAVAVGAMLYEYFTEHKIEITRDMATALYTSIATDTGCFMQANTDSYSHAAAAVLIAKGIDLESINYNNFKLYCRNLIPGLAYALRKIEFFNDGAIALVFLSHKVIQKYNLADELNQFKKYVSEASGVRVGIVISEKTKGEFNISLRSNGDLNMAGVAEFFGGGGHKNAAGFSVQGKYKRILHDILTQVQKCIAKS